MRVHHQAGIRGPYLHRTARIRREIAWLTPLARYIKGTGPTRCSFLVFRSLPSIKGKTWYPKGSHRIGPQRDSTDLARLTCSPENRSGLPVMNLRMESRNGHRSQIEFFASVLRSRFQFVRHGFFAYTTSSSFGSSTCIVAVSLLSIPFPLPAGKYGSCAVDRVPFAGPGGLDHESPMVSQGAHRHHITEWHQKMKYWRRGIYALSPSIKQVMEVKQ